MSPLRALAAAALAASALALAGCAAGPKKDPPPPPSSAGAAKPGATPGRRVSPYAPAQEDPSTRGDYVAGGLYKPGVSDTTPTYVPDVDAIPEPEVVDAPRSRYGNRNPYVVLGKSYAVLDAPDGYREQGLASYYGQKFHGRKTSNHEVYDMYAFTAAHKSLPLPSFARVTNLDTGQSVVVRVNDRGPFHEGRVVDLSYAAAVKIGVHPRGTARVEVVGLSPGENARLDRGAVASAPPPPAPAPAAAAARPAVDPATGLPPGVRVATGRPQPAPPSGIDRFVAALPIAAAQAGERTPGAAARPSDPPAATAATAATTTTTTAPAAPGGNGHEWRFDMAQGGRTMTADEFDAWMKSRRARVATGTAGTPDPHGSASPEARAAAAAAAAEAEKTLTWRERRALKRAEAERAKAAETATAAAKAPPSPATAAAPAPKPAAETAAAARVADTTPSPAAPVATTGAAGGVTLQVAAFGARGNAERALGMLRGAGVGDARVVDGTSAGKPVFRVRVGPVDAGRVAELGARVAGLGFGAPQVVRE